MSRFSLVTTSSTFGSRLWRTPRLQLLRPFCILRANLPRLLAGQIHPRCALDEAGPVAGAAAPGLDRLAQFGLREGKLLGMREEILEDADLERHLGRRVLRKG
ncbi:hypothetical protein N234_36890 [Ralstonia pickettii DTP0602]|nr:hypothetical protein N234_36890 [Ralstonia pickettii DTP0602]